MEVRLNTNESPFPPPSSFQPRLIERMRELSLNRYPERAYGRVREALAELSGTSPERIFAGNGSNEVLLNLCLAYGGHGRSAVIFEPSYSLHSHIARLSGTEVLIHRRTSDYEAELTEGALSDVERSTLTFLCSPNNPTGTVEQVSSVSTVLSRSGGVVVLDEAYGEFADRGAYDGLRGSEQLVSVRTMSKWFSLAGLRFGYLVAPQEIVGILDEVVLPYHLDQIKQAAVLSACELRDDFAAQTHALVEMRAGLVAGLSDLGISTLPSGANFLFMRFPNGSADRIWEGLLDRSVLIRNMKGAPYLEGGLRVTVGSAEENDRFLEALAAVLNEVAKKEIARG